MAKRKTFTPKATTPKINQRALILAVNDYPEAANDLLIPFLKTS